MSKFTKRIAEGALFGAVVGYVAGILTAPKSGKETRTNIKTATERSIVIAEKHLKAAHTQLVELLSESKQRVKDNGGKANKELNEAIASAQKVKQRVRELLSAIHEGDVEDKDLKAAVADADKAIKHLKTFFSKAG